MALVKHLYDLGYRFARMPWDIGPRSELVGLVKEGQLKPGRALDLGCGGAANTIFLAQHGFQTTGIDFAPSAIALGRRRAAEAGLDVELLVDDLTDIKHVRGPFDVLVDYGTLDDLRPVHRRRYRDNVIPLTRPGTRFLLWCFEWPTRWWRPDAGAMRPGEVEALFGADFAIDRIAGEQDKRTFPWGWGAYLMTRQFSE